MSGMRIGGLASGMDIDQLVSDLMKAERIPLDKLNQKKQYMEWQRDDYRDLNKALLEFDTLIFDSVLKKASYIQKTISNTNPGAVSINNINSTSDFSGTIEVHNLASAGSMYSNSQVTIDPTVKLADLGIGSQAITIRSTAKDGTLGTEKTVTIDSATDTLDSVIAKINSQTDVSAYYDKTKGTLSLIAKNTGDVLNSSEIVIGSDGNFWTQMNMASDNETAKLQGTGASGVNASLTYNGMPIEKSTNTFNINGVEFKLNNTTTEPVTFSSSTDTEAVLSTIMKFVDGYNSLIENIQGKLEEKKYRDFQPLSTEQKDAMKEKDIERWEEKARSGTLRGDSILSGALNNMRLSLYTTVTGLTGTDKLFDIGITTSSNYRDGGKLVVNTEKLKAAITENPNALYDLFSKEGTGDAQGLGRRLRDTLKATMVNIEKRAGKTTSINNNFTIGRTLDSIDDQIDRFQERMINVENRYWRQFTAMEKAIQQSNSQSMYLMQQFGGGY
ncbi:flagellar hook-associated protein 2 [Mesobacillus jeotgali]|uniref:Flagellar hook-associated protein 2 n=1 Tax=Mesobacillus jeotgali TaxID=129985 RepID=A0ABY9VLM8_9BACI|nr:flagellar hook-associated protein 2 [Mesobacillus jeotgali]WNF22607.1 flagellar hook-associated protein 2 [Mesobacillus jeotgali]